MSKIFYLIGIFCWASIGVAQDPQDEIKVNLNNSNFRNYAPNSLALPSLNTFQSNSIMQSNFSRLDIGFKSPLNNPLKLNFTPSNSFSFGVTDYSSVCYNPFAFQFSANFLNTLNSFNDIERQLQCSSIKEGSLGTFRFSHEYCQAYTNCAKNIDQSNIFSMSSIVSQEYVQFMLINNIHQMESIEKINAFAFDNFDKKDIQLSCPLPISFDSTDQDAQKRCTPGIIDDVFLGLQKKCNPQNNYSCYGKVKVDGKDFSDFHKSSKDKDHPKSALVEFFTKKVASDTKSIKESAEKSINDLASIIDENVDEKKKMENLLSALALMSKENRLDPILNFESRNFADIANFKETNLYKKLNSLIANNNKSSTSAPKTSTSEELKKLRLELFKELNGENCKKPKSFNEICQNAKSLSEGKYIEGIYTMDNDRFFPKENEEYVRNLPLNEGGGNSAKKNFFTLLESVRCKAFNFSGANGGGQKPWYNLKDPPTASDFQFNEKAETKNNLSTNSGSGSFDKYSSVLREVEPGNYSNGENWSKSLEKKLQVGDGESTNVDRSGELANSKLSPDANDSSSSLSPSTPATPTNTASLNPNTFNTANALAPSIPNANFVNDEAPPAEDKTTSSSKSSDLTSKVDSLSKKLADSEDKIEKINKENEEKARNLEFQNKQQEYDSQLEGLNSQISNLQKENEKLKSQNTKTSLSQNLQDNISSNNENQEAQNPKDFASAARADFGRQSRSSDDPPSDNSSPSPSYAGGGGSASNSSASSSESAPSTSSKSSFGGSASAGNNTGASGRSGITLTRIDDMSADKAEETIYALIETNNGKPFTVEEGGFVKEIIPLVVEGKIQIDSKTGKPVYQKVTKGKVAAMKNASAPKDNALAGPISSNADLVRAEEERLKRERVEYLKLKKQAQKALQLPH